MTCWAQQVIRRQLLYKPWGTQACSSPIPPSPVLLSLIRLVPSKCPVLLSAQHQKTQNQFRAFYERYCFLSCLSLCVICLHALSWTFHKNCAMCLVRSWHTECTFQRYDTFCSLSVVSRGEEERKVVASDTPSLVREQSFEACSSSLR
jgi:hypothetical protein